MNNLVQFAALAALIIGGFGGVAFVLTIRGLDKRIDRIDKRIETIANAIVASRG